MKLRTVITVDDEPSIHEGLDAIMDWESLGYRHIGSATNGNEAYRYISQMHPDVIITDIRMPELDGLALIRLIREINDYEPSIIIISGYNDFEYARTALRNDVHDYLLKPIDEEELATRLGELRMRAMEERLRTKSSRLQSVAALSTVVRRLALSEPDNKFFDYAKQLIHADSDARFCFALILPIDAAGAEGRIGLAIDQVRGAIAASKIKRSENLLYRDTAGSIGVLVHVNNNGETNGIDQLWAKGLFRKLSDVLRQRLFLGIGKVVSGLDLIWKSRASLLNLLSLRHSIRGPGFMVHDLNGVAVDGPASIDPSTITKLMDVIETGRLGEIGITLSSVTNGLHSISAPALREWIHSVLAECAHLIAQLDGTEPEEIDGLRRLIKEIEFVSLDLLEERLLATLSIVAKMVMDLRVVNRNGTVALMKRHIDRHIGEHLSLKELAERLGMNAAYLGRIFKRVLGVGFKDYQRSRRIHTAQRMLRNTDLRVPNIAAEVGYLDVDHFTDQFKRECGLSPTAYRASEIAH